MTKGLAVIGLVFLLGFALYGGIRLASDSLTKEEGEKAARAAHPFVEGAASVANEKIKETLKNTPDKQLEKDAELYARKLYPVAKGALKGQLEAITKDPDSNEIPEMMRQAGKDVTERVIKPFTEGLAQGSGSVLKDLDKTVENVRKFTEENRDFIESVTSGLKGLHETLKEGAPVPPPLPGLKPLNRLPLPQPPAPLMGQSDPRSETDHLAEPGRMQPANPDYQTFPPSLPLPHGPLMPPRRFDSRDQHPQQVQPESQYPERKSGSQSSEGRSREDAQRQDSSRMDQGTSDRAHAQ